MRGERQTAFTLLEVLLVIALIGLVAAVAWPDFGRARQVADLQESAWHMQTLVAMCRAEAMNTSRVHRVLIRPDGTVRVQRQLDALLAPHVYVSVTEYWGREPILAEDVWVEAVERLPDGPPPYRIMDDKLELPEVQIQPERIEEQEHGVAIDFAPDGSCPSLRWVLRDPRGRAVLLTLDGRLGRVTTEDWESVSPEDVERPEPVEEEPEPKYDLEDFRRR